MEIFIACSNCGHLIKPSSPGEIVRFCPQCGQALSESKQQQSHRILNSVKEQFGGFQYKYQTNRIVFDLKKLNSKVPFKKVFLISSFLGAFVVSYFIAFLIATAGTALSPPLGKLRVPLAARMESLLLTHKIIHINLAKEERR